MPHRSDQRPFGVVVNPAAALGRARRTGERVIAELQRLGHTFVRISGHTAAECQHAIARHAPTVQSFLLVGGDGLLSVFVNVPEARQKPFGVIPAGSGNDFARQFGIPRNVTRAVHHALAHLTDPRPVDAALVRTPELDLAHTARWFVGGLSIGFDANINRRANDLKLPLGPMRYQIGLIAEILQHRPEHFDVTYDGHVNRFDGVLTTIMNIRTLGGGMPITPNARTNDGQLDVIMVHAASRPRLLSVLGRLARGTHTTLPEVRIERAASITVNTAAVGYADGERVGYGPFTVTAHPHALQLLA